MITTDTAEANRVIEALGGPSKLGALLDISKSAVSQWKKNGIPKSQMRYLRNAHPEAFAPSSPNPQPAAVTADKPAKEVA
jgi:hypothetical protein